MSEAERRIFEIEVTGTYEVAEPADNTLDEGIADGLKVFDAWDGFRCAECGTAIARRPGLGVRPKYCDEHRTPGKEGASAAKKVADDDPDITPTVAETSTKVCIPSIREDDAPIAFLIHEMFDIKAIRAFEGRLFAPYLLPHKKNEAVLAGSVHFPYSTELIDSPGFAQSRSASEFEKRARNHYRRFLAIDGFIWEEAPEPCYQVTKIGSRSNSSVTIAVATAEDGGQLFAADNFEGALLHAMDVARESGKMARASELEKRGMALKAIEVVAPDAVSLVAFPPPPKKVQSLRDAYAEARERAQELRSRILSMGYTPTAALPYEARHRAEEDL